MFFGHAYNPPIHRSTDRRLDVNDRETEKYSIHIKSSEVRTKMEPLPTSYLNKVIVELDEDTDDTSSFYQRTIPISPTLKLSTTS
jgi:hypothetical protein